MNTDGVSSFTRSRLVLARARRDVTQRALGEQIGVTDRMIKAYEKGDKLPSPETLAAISGVLGFPVSFFCAPHIDPLEATAASFRALTKASASLRDRALASGTIAMDFHRILSQRFNLPAPDLPDLRGTLPSAAAAALRQVWGIGQKPISNLVHLLELHGVRVFSLNEDSEAIDAFSLWRDGTPFVFLNTRKTAERSIFDAAHELGHLVLHRHGIPQGQNAEDAADMFASSFVLPEHAFRATAPRLATIATLSALKRTWRGSVAMLGRRMHDLGLMTDWHYRQFCIELSRKGRANEPAPLPRETSAVLQKVMADLAIDGLGLRELAREIHVPVGELRAFTFGLTAVEGGGASGSSRANLRLVT